MTRQLYGYIHLARYYQNSTKISPPPPPPITSIVPNSGSTAHYDHSDLLRFFSIGQTPSIQWASSTTNHTSTGRTKQPLYTPEQPKLSPIPRIHQFPSASEPAARPLHYTERTQSRLAAGARRRSYSPGNYVTGASSCPARASRISASRLIARGRLAKDILPPPPPRAAIDKLAERR